MTETLYLPVAQSGARCDMQIASVATVSNERIACYTQKTIPLYLREFLREHSLLFGIRELSLNLRERQCLRESNSLIILREIIKGTNT